MDLKEAGSRRVSDTRHPWEQARVKVIAQLLEAYSPALKQKSSLVADIGCGDIYVAERLHDHYPSSRWLAIDKAFTPDLLDAYRLQSKSRPINLFTGVDEAQKSVDKPMDVILLLDVIEHIEDDTAFLKDLLDSSLFGKHTLVLISVPAFQSLFCSHDRFLGHHRRYAHRQLQSQLQELGLKVKRSGYFFSLLLLPRLLQVFKERLSPPKQISTDLVDWQGGSFKTHVLTNILTLDARIGLLMSRLGLPMPGLSTFAVCHK